MEVKPGYKQTEVGVIPEEWEVKSLSAVSSMKSGEGITASRIDQHSQYPCYGGNGLRGFTSRYTHDGAFALIGRQGALCGNVVGVSGKLFASEHAVVVTPRQGTNIQFLTYVLGEMHLNRLSEASAQPGLSVSKILQLIIGTPPTEAEQHAIAKALSDVDGLLDGLDRLIAKKRDLKQAAMQQLLTGQTRLPGFHGDWVPLNMADNSTLKARIGWQGLTTAEYLKTGDYFLVTGTDFSEGRIAWSSCCFVAAQRYTQDRNIQLRAKDILLTKDGTIGKVAYVDHLPALATLNSGVFVIRPKNEAYDPHFFYYILTSHIFDEFLNKLAAGSTISHLYQKDFVTFSFLVPPSLPEQTAIAKVLTEMDGELAVLEQRREKTRALKQAMMQELLTGRTRLV
jgi:type I restriction enzyme S subunit